MNKINAIFWNPVKKQNIGFWHSFTRQSSDMAHRSTDYTAQNSSRASTSCQKKHHPDHPAPPPLCIRSARFIATIYPRGILFFDQRRHIDDDAACSSFRDWRSWREVKEITRRTKPWVQVEKGKEWRKEDCHDRPLERDALCHLTTHASSFMPLDSGDRTWHSRSSFPRNGLFGSRTYNVSCMCVSLLAQGGCRIRAFQGEF